jgi:hypothetical protein
MERHEMTDRKAARAQLIEWALKLHHHGQMQSQSDRDSYVAAMLAILDLVINNVVDLSPLPLKQNAFITPIPARPVIDSLPKLKAARERLARLQQDERRLAALAWNKQTAADDEKLRVTRSEIMSLGIEIKIVSAMERTAHAG